MKLYKFRALGNCKDLKTDDLGRIKDIIDTDKFHCSNFLDFNDMNEGVFSINPENIGITLPLKQQYKICSFSTRRSLKNQLMWGHYANAGMGVAIEIEVGLKKDLKNKKIKQVEYSQVKYSNEYSRLDSIEDILTHKSKKWSYENEFRYLSNEGTEDKVKIGKITKIYFGTPYEDLENYDDIKKEHEKLRKYLSLKEELEGFCEGKSILCEDYHFNK